MGDSLSGETGATFVDSLARLSPPTAVDLAEALGHSEPLPAYSGEPITFYRDESSDATIPPLSLRFKVERSVATEAVVASERIPINDPRYCAHPNAEPVRSSGEVVAGLCLNCDTQLPAEWFSCTHANTVEMSGVGEKRGIHLCNGCRVTFFKPPPEPIEVGRIHWLPPTDAEDRFAAELQRWKAEARKWKALSRKWENRAKNAEVEKMELIRELNALKAGKPTTPEAKRLEHRRARADAILRGDTYA